MDFAGEKEFGASHLRLLRRNSVHYGTLQYIYRDFPPLRTPLHLQFSTGSVHGSVFLCFGCSHL
jgi:hypothetical protein